MSLFLTFVTLYDPILDPLTDISWNNWTSFCNEPIQIWAMLTIDHGKAWMNYFIFSEFHVVTMSVDAIIFWWHGSLNMKDGFTIFDFDLAFLSGWLAVNFYEIDRVWITDISACSIRTSLKMTLHNVSVSKLKISEIFYGDWKSRWFPLI